MSLRNPEHPGNPDLGLEWGHRESGGCKTAEFRAGPEKTFCTLDVQSREYMGMVK